jgi:thiamine kinase-like enzyme
MDSFEAWPATVTSHLRAVYGIPIAIERPGGMSGASVHRVRFAEGSVIVKSSSSGRESLFYRHADDQLERGGVCAPRLLWSAEIDELHWLVLEDIPASAPIAPPDRWQPNAGMVAMIARLHSLTLALPVELANFAKWDWTVDATDDALSFFPAAVARNLAPPLQALREEAQHLAAPWCWISGDPNPSNWGTRADGSLVLFDWELVRRGTPPTDLAILVAGLGDETKFAQMAACYLDLWQTISAKRSWPAATLARDIALAKIWTVVMLLRACVSGRANVPAELRGQMAESVPPWVRSLAR